MDRKPSIAICLVTVAAMLPCVNAQAADAAPKADEPRTEKDKEKSVNSPEAAEPVKPGTLDKIPQVVAPGTMDAPPKPVAPGTLDKNVINPDVEIQKGLKPVPR
jgi:hypothetical protein